MQRFVRYNLIMNDLQLFLDSFWKILIPGLTITIPLTVVSFSLAIVIGTITALIQFANVKVLKQIAKIYIWIIRGTPLLVQLLLIFYGLPSVGIVLDPFPAAIIVFSLNEGAYTAETIRGALESINVGQIEAGYCVGMNFIQIMWHIILPQAFKNAFPSLANSLISMVKDSSLASNITVIEMLMKTKQLVSVYYEPLLLYSEAGIIYLLFSTVLSKIARTIENRLKSKVVHHD